MLGSLHGLHNAGAIRLADAGAANWEIASYLAHKDTKQAVARRLPSRTRCTKTVKMDSLGSPTDKVANSCHIAIFANCLHHSMHCKLIDKVCCGVLDGPKEGAGPCVRNCHVVPPTRNL